jgi:stage III sporulation protein SpoIIIAA
MQVAKLNYNIKLWLKLLKIIPQVIIIDEIGTDLEVLASRTIAEKGSARRNNSR